MHNEANFTEPFRSLEFALPALCSQMHPDITDINAIGRRTTKPLYRLAHPVQTNLSHITEQIMPINNPSHVSHATYVKLQADANTEMDRNIHIIKLLLHQSHVFVINEWKKKSADSKKPKKSQSNAYAQIIMITFNSRLLIPDSQLPSVSEHSSSKGTLNNFESSINFAALGIFKFCSHRATACLVISNSSANFF